MGDDGVFEIIWSKTIEKPFKKVRTVEVSMVVEGALKASLTKEDLERQDGVSQVRMVEIRSTAGLPAFRSSL